MKVRFQVPAQEDLAALAAIAGADTALGYIERIEAACLALAQFPERGTRQDHLASGVRTMGFERRATIAFRIVDTEVLILRVLYGGQDLDRQLGDLDP